jgi:predicted dehydrogenase
VTCLRIGLSGCSPTAGDLVVASRRQPDGDIVAVHDRHGGAAAFADRHGLGTVALDFPALLATGIDCVVLADPTADRLQQVQLAAEQSVPCLVTAPLANDVATATAMVAAAEAAGLKLGVVVPGCDDPLLEQLRRMLAHDWLGGLVAVQAMWGDRRALAGRDHATVEPLLDLGAPLLHLLSWLLGRSAVDGAAQSTAGFTPGQASTTVATLRLRGNVLATLAVSHLTAVRSFAVHGTDGGVRVADDRIWLRGHTAFHGHVFDYLTPGEEMVFSRHEVEAGLRQHGPARDPIGCFARWLDDRDDFPCPGEQALHDLRALDALRRSSSSGRRETS